MLLNYWKQFGNYGNGQKKVTTWRKMVIKDQEIPGNGPEMMENGQKQVAKW